MNHNFDFRDSSVWDETPISSSPGDDFKELLDFLGLCFCLVVIAIGVFG